MLGPRLYVGNILEHSHALENQYSSPSNLKLEKLYSKIIKLGGSGA